MFPSNYFLYLLTRHTETRVGVGQRSEAGTKARVHTWPSHQARQQREARLKLHVSCHHFTESQSPMFIINIEGITVFSVKYYTISLSTFNKSLGCIFSCSQYCSMFAVLCLPQLRLIPVWLLPPMCGLTHCHPPQTCNDHCKCQKIEGTSCILSNK